MDWSDQIKISPRPNKSLQTMYSLSQLLIASMKVKYFNNH